MVQVRKSSPPLRAALRKTDFWFEDVKKIALTNCFQRKNFKLFERRKFLKFKLGKEIFSPENQVGSLAQPLLSKVGRTYLSKASGLTALPSRRTSK